MERTMLLSVAIPGVFAFFVMLAALFLPRTFNACGKRQWADDLLRNVLGAIAVAGGFLISFQIQEGLPQWPPTQRWHWLAIMAAGAGVAGCLHGLWPRRALGRVITGLGLGVIAMLSLQPLPAFGQPWLWKTGLGLAVLVLWLSSDAFAARRTGHLMPLVMMLTLSAASVVVLEAASSAKFAMTVAALACMCGAIMAITLFARRFSFAGGPLAVLTTLLPAWLMMAHFYDYKQVYSPAVFVLIALAPLTVWLSQLPPVKRWGGWKAWMVPVGAALILLIAAAGIMFASMPSPEQPEAIDPDFDYGY